VTVGEFIKAVVGVFVVCETWLVVWH